MGSTFNPFLTGSRRERVIKKYKTFKKYRDRMHNDHSFLVKELNDLYKGTFGTLYMGSSAFPPFQVRIIKVNPDNTFIKSYDNFQIGFTLKYLGEYGYDKETDVIFNLMKDYNWFMRNDGNYYLYLESPFGIYHRMQDLKKLTKAIQIGTRNPYM